MKQRTNIREQTLKIVFLEIKNVDIHVALSSSRGTILREMNGSVKRQ